MDIEHGILFLLIGLVTSVAVMYLILTVMSNEGIDDKDED